MSGDNVTISDALHVDLCGKHILSFLTAKDALTFATTSKENKDTACLGIFEPVKLHDGFVSWGDSFGSGDNQHRWKEIHVPIAIPTHSVQFSCKWKDQGWGNRKGRLYITGYKDCEDLDPPFKYEDVVCSTDCDAEHDWRPLRLQFLVEEGKRYFVWYKVGGGGGHELFLRNPVVHSLIYDNYEGYLVRQQRALVAKGAYGDAPLFPLLLRAVALYAQCSFADDGESMINKSIIDALEDLGLSTSNKNAMDALVVLASSMSNAVRDEEPGNNDGDYMTYDSY